MGRTKPARVKRRARQERAREARGSARFQAMCQRRQDAFQIVEMRGIEQGRPAAERLLERAPYVSDVPGDVAYGIDFGDEEGPSLFGQSCPDDEPDWVTGLYLLPDGMDLAAEEASDNWRRTPDHLAFYGELESIGKQWWAENEAFPLEGRQFGGRPAREAQLRQLFDRWSVQYPGLVGTVG